MLHLTPTFSLRRRNLIIDTDIHKILYLLLVSKNKSHRIHELSNFQINRQHFSFITTLLFEKSDHKKND